MYQLCADFFIRVMGNIPESAGLDTVRKDSAEILPAAYIPLGRITLNEVCAFYRVFCNTGMIADSFRRTLHIS